jgi:hypothetical protein
VRILCAYNYIGNACRFLFRCDSYQTANLEDEDEILELDAADLCYQPPLEPQLSCDIASSFKAKL